MARARRFLGGFGRSPRDIRHRVLKYWSEIGMLRSHFHAEHGFLGLLAPKDLGAVAAAMLRHHGNDAIQDIMRRIDKDCLVGTLSYSDPETGSHF